MSKEFIDNNFMLHSKEAQRLYHDYAEGMPILDYHCHLKPEEVLTDKRWENITQIWLYGDHYKWRVMRSNGIDEHFCTGDATDREKFDKFAETMPYLLRNPMYHWSHLELTRYFGIGDKLLSPATADEIWERTKERLAEPGLSARGLMKSSNVEMVCTTDDPIDTLDAHKGVAADEGFDIKMLPTWRPDKGMAVEDSVLFNGWVDKLAERADVDVVDYKSFLAAMRNRHDYFHTNGCRLSDHGLETVFADDCTPAEMSSIFDAVRSGKELSVVDIAKFKSGMMLEFGRMDAEKNWVQQIHYGALRNNNSAMFNSNGADIGFDSIGDLPIAAALSKFMDRLNDDGMLPKTILYTLNPRDNEVLASMIGNFQGDAIAGKIQFGSGWWVNDQKDGMERQMEALSQMGLLSRFVGMLTDSRSFLSYTRHEYFRRILCNMLGNDMKGGLVPEDFDLVGRMVSDICYNNAKQYFGV